MKIDLKISGKNVLLLSNVIEQGPAVKEDGKASELLNSILPENLGELKASAGEYLQNSHSFCFQVVAGYYQIF